MDSYGHFTGMPFRAAATQIEKGNATTFGALTKEGESTRHRFVVLDAFVCKAS